MAKYQILRQEKDMAGKIMVWVDMSNDEVQIFKFSKTPIETEVKNVVDNFIASKETEKQRGLEMIDEQITLLTERKKQLETPKP